MSFKKYASEQYVDEKVSQLSQEIEDKLDASELTTAVNDALAQAKASGEFDGADGQDGKDGADGYTPVKGVDYFDGDPGADGEDGYSPTVDLTETADGVAIIVTNKDGQKSAIVKHGTDGQGGATVYAGASLAKVVNYGNILSQKETDSCMWPFGMCQYDEDIDKVVFMYNASVGHGVGPCSVYMRTIDCQTLEVSESSLVADTITINGTVYCAVSYMFFIKLDGTYEVIVKASEYDSTEKAVAYYKYLSADKGATWTLEATDIFDKMTSVIGSAKNCYAPTRLSNNRIICTAIGSKQGAMYSDDDGDTWTVVYMNAGTSWEGCIVELDTPGHLCCINRHVTQTNDYSDIVPAWLNYSDDYGETWTEPVASASMPDMTACNCCYVTDDGRVNLFYGSRYNAGDYTATMYKQSGTLEQLASDTLDPPVAAFRGSAVYGMDFGYPACCKDKYGQIYLVYYDGDAEIADKVTIKLAIASRENVYTPINDHVVGRTNTYSAEMVEKLLADQYRVLMTKINDIIISGGGSVDDEGNGSYPVTNGLVHWFDVSSITSADDAITWGDKVGDMSLTPASYDSDTMLANFTSDFAIGSTDTLTSSTVVAFELVSYTDGSPLAHSEYGTYRADIIFYGNGPTILGARYPYNDWPTEIQQFSNKLLHLVLNVDFTNGIVEVFVNGKLQLSMSGFEFDMDGTRKWHLRSNYVGNFRIYDHILTADEVANNYKYEQSLYSFDTITT